MDIERNIEPEVERVHEVSRKAGSPPVTPVLRAKSSLRLKYEAETHVIERKIGSLESIRNELGLSQRKIAQLLLVDPSAWTRWTKGGDTPPPHIYRMLQWYLALEEKYPALDVNFWLNTVAQLPAHADESLKTIAELKRRIDKLEKPAPNTLASRIRLATYVLVLFAGIALGLALHH